MLYYVTLLVPDQVDREVVWGYYRKLNRDWLTWICELREFRANNRGFYEFRIVFWNEAKRTAFIEAFDKRANEFLTDDEAFFFQTIWPTKRLT